MAKPMRSRVYIFSILTINLCIWLALVSLSMQVAAFHSADLSQMSTTVPRYLNPSLKIGFYNETCPQVGKIVEERIAYWTSIDDTTPSPLLRLFFHDCLVYGCDASVLLNSSYNATAEKDADVNFSLGNFFVIDEIKERLEIECPGVVSCADILALVGVYSIKQAGGPLYNIELGRRDGLTSFSYASHVFLPSFNLTVDGLLANFEYFGLDVVDLVALSGAHTIGQGHCKSIQDRIFPKVDSRYSHGYGEELLALCTLNGTMASGTFDDEAQYFLDPVSTHVFDNGYFKSLLDGRGVFTSDVSLVADNRTRPWVELFAADEKAFLRQFGKSLRKMGKIGVLSGEQGQIRKQCWIRNCDSPNFAFNPDHLLPAE
ncbi:hypothetical protein KP509_32G049200 [Ceratopteris richardii]|uniref:Peroxidase n=1 Tax=Ceratopteris richardii TaxID=49495 RepID=A0A8T2QVE6_CERRI|nr:hypothetical protein KP509_32G049200 [Ceratopteris richardii]